MIIESGDFSVDTAPLTASWAGHIVADIEKRRLIFLFSSLSVQMVRLLVDVANEAFGVHLGAVHDLSVLDRSDALRRATGR